MLGACLPNTDYTLAAIASTSRTYFSCPESALKSLLTDVDGSAAANGSKEKGTVKVRGVSVLLLGSTQDKHGGDQGKEGEDKQQTRAKDASLDGSAIHTDVNATRQKGEIWIESGSQSKSNRHAKRPVERARSRAAILAIKDLIADSPSLPREKEKGEDEDELNRETRHSSGAGILLVAKIVGAAAQLGYGFEPVRRLAELVRPNVRTVDCRTTPTIDVRGRADEGPEEEGEKQSKEGREDVALERRIDFMLSRMLRPAEASSGQSKAALHVNSNEPVLLLNLPGAPDAAPSAARQRIHHILAHTLTLLQRDYNIRPVRVYAGAYLPSFDNDEEESRSEDGNEDGTGNGKGHGKDGFSISLLNVVNTELGGPGMVALLDQTCGIKAWGLGLMGKEEWESRGRDGTASLEWLVEMGLRNWEAVGRGAEGSGEEGVKREEGGEKERVGGTATEAGKSAEVAEDEDEGEDHLRERDVSPAGLGASPIKSADSVAISADGISQAAGLDTTESPKPDIPVLEETRPEPEPKSDPDKEESVGAEDENVIQSESKEETDRALRTGQSEKTVEPRERTAHVSESGISAEEEGEGFEIVDRERTLIDMVFGHGRGKGR